MSKTAAQKTQQNGSELYFQTYQKLLQQRARTDRDLLKLQSKFFKAISRKKGVLHEKKVKYVPRCKNTNTLVHAIHECMIPNQEMTMEDILTSLAEKKLYHTRSKGLYTMVNNKANRDPIIKKVRRGVFVYKPRSKKKESAVA